MLADPVRIGQCSLRASMPPEGLVGPRVALEPEFLLGSISDFSSAPVQSSLINEALGPEKTMTTGRQEWWMTISRHWKMRTGWEQRCWKVPNEKGNNDQQPLPGWKIHLSGSCCSLLLWPWLPQTITTFLMQDCPTYLPIDLTLPQFPSNSIPLIHLFNFETVPLATIWSPSAVSSRLIEICLSF